MHIPTLKTSIIHLHICPFMHVHIWLLALLRIPNKLASKRRSFLPSQKGAKKKKGLEEGTPRVRIALLRISTRVRIEEEGMSCVARVRVLRHSDAAGGEW
jgi:hypothetical protein